MRWMMALALLGIILPSLAWAGADKEATETQSTYACPDSITVEPQKLAKSVKGWNSFSDSDTKYPLVAVTIYTKGKKMVQYEPDKGTEDFTEWHLANNGKAKYFLVCGYAHTAMLLKRELAASLTQCRLSFGADAENPVVSRVMRNMTCQ